MAAQAEEIKAYNLEVINTADWFVNLGPKGNAGGKGVVIGSTDPYAVLCRRTGFTLDFIRRSNQFFLVRSIVAI